MSVETMSDVSAADIPLGIVHLVGDGPDAVSRCQARLLDGMERRRLFEEWRTGKRFYLVFNAGFVSRDHEMGAVIELRARLRETRLSEGSFMADKDGCGRRWRGPNTPLPEKAVAAGRTAEIEDLPFAMYSPDGSEIDVFPEDDDHRNN